MLSRIRFIGRPAIVLAGLAAAISTASAQHPTNFVRPPGKVVCSTRECIYTPVNKPASELVYDMIRVAFGDSPPLEGYVRELRSGGQLAFSHPDASTMDTLKAAAIEYDGLAEFHPYARVAITVEIYQVESTFLDSLMASIQIGEKVANPVDMDRASVVSDAGAVSISGVLGNLPTSFVKLQLNMGKDRGVRNMKNHFSLIVPNGSSLDYSKQQVLYRDSENSVANINEKVGLSISGVININGLDTDQVRIKDFQMRYGVPTSDERSLVNAVSTSIATVDIRKGTSYVISSDELEVDEVRKKNAFIFGGGRQKGKSSQRLLLLISVTPIPPMGK